MRVPIKVVYQDGGVKRLVGVARDAVEFERRYAMPYARIWGVPAIEDVDGNTTVPAVPPMEEWWYFLAWTVLKRTGEDTRDFEAFVNAIEGVTFDVQDKDDPDKDESAELDPAPFKKAPTDGSSGGSPPQE